MAANKQFDLFGAYIVGLVTAIGGGTIRDLCLGVTPFWMLNASYLIWSGVALLFVIFFRVHLFRFNNTFFIFDTIGLALFTVVGIEKTLAMGFDNWVAIVMGMITGAAGGVFRDIFINQPREKNRRIRQLKEITSCWCFAFFNLVVFLFCNFIFYFYCHYFV